jgi:large subunit ribosomal protein L21
MYAIIANGGHQYKVEVGQKVEVDYSGLAAGEKVTFDRVLALEGDDGLKIGAPVVEGATVTAEVLKTSQGPKIYIQKLRRRKNARRRTGHRQFHTTVLISEINAG